MPKSWCVLGWMSEVATPQVTSTIYNVYDVCSHWSNRAKRAWLGHSLGLVTTFPEWDLGVESSAMELTGPGMTREEIRKVYNKVYQLKRAPGMNPCNVEMAENICQEILDSIKEQLCCRWDHARPKEEPGQISTSTSRPDPLSEFQQMVCATYNHFRDLKEGSCKQALAVAWDAHRQALAAAALLKDKIERLSHSISHSHWWTGSHR